jgi:FKBP-type peptidyl-prolyl cis-trans isomerase
MAMKIAKMQKIREKSASRMQKRVEERRSKREAREEEEQVKKGTTVMDSGAMSSVIRPEDDEYVIDTKVPSRKIFVMATGEKARASTIAKLKRNLRAVACRTIHWSALAN